MDVDVVGGGCTERSGRGDVACRAIRHDLPRVVVWRDGDGAACGRRGMGRGRESPAGTVGAGASRPRRGWTGGAKLAAKRPNPIIHR
ncbi:hypothetical protein GUJ93_ZPchr0007g3389 [Zizania palustris]|uniref:Uncharacterized protein n=1 Tax=Zizania palustris TaxID=103762 RepID=A0A8J5TIS7_ZIZPA|nr:hypothetical protein GUJ93_ZPchr0007g3389 [Zizania palustris]